MNLQIPKKNRKNLLSGTIQPGKSDVEDHDVAGLDDTERDSFRRQRGDIFLRNVLQNEIQTLWKSIFDRRIDGVELSEVEIDEELLRVQRRTSTLPAAAAAEKSSSLTFFANE